MPFAKNDVDVQEDYEAAVLQEYSNKGPLSLEDALIVQDVYGNAPLTAVAIFETETACDVSVTVHGKNEQADITYNVGDVVTHHEVPIFGLYAGTTNRVTIQAGQQSVDHYIVTDAIPDSVSLKIKANSNNDITKIADGQLYMLSEVNHIVFDVNGDIRWYLGEKYTANASSDYSNAFPMMPDKDGLWISYNPATGWVYNKNCEIIYMNWMGKILKQFSYQDENSDHDSTLLPDGNLLYYSQGILYYMDISTGKTSKYLDLATIFDPSVGNINPEGNNDTAWSHVNTVEYVSDNNSLLISIRNQHLVCNIDYQTKEIIWAMTPAYSEIDGEIIPIQSAIKDTIILPDKEDTDFEWFYSQHDPSFISYDEENQVFEFVLFDNGSFRYLVGEEPNNLKYSRIVRYKVDLKTMTATQTYEYGKEEGLRLYSVAYGSAEFVSQTNHYIGNFRGHNQIYPNSSIVTETDADGNLIAEFEVVTPDGGWGSYRADSLFLGEKSFQNCNFDSNNRGLTYIQYHQTEWKATESPSLSTEKLSTFNLDELYTDGDYIYTYGTAMVENSTQTDIAEIVAVNELTNENFSYAIGIAKNVDGKFYGRGVPLESLPDGEYMLYIRATNGRGLTASEFTGYKITKGSQTVTTSDILITQNSVNQSLMTYVSQGSYSIENPYLTVDPYGISPLSAIASFKTTKPASITVEVESKNGASNVINRFETLTTEHQIPIYGLYANDETQVTLTARYSEVVSIVLRKLVCSLWHE